MARVLYVEDQQGWKELLERYLTSAGHETIYATSIETTVSLLEGKKKFDVIVFDLLLPDPNLSLLSSGTNKDPFEWLSALIHRLQHRRLPIPPIIVVTGYPLSKERIIELFSCYRQVVDFHEKKNFQRSVFLESIAKLPSHSTKTRTWPWRIVAALAASSLGLLIMWALMIGIRLIPDPQTQQAWLNLVPSVTTFVVVLLFVLNYDGPLHDLISLVTGKKSG